MVGTASPTKTDSGKLTRAAGFRARLRQSRPSLQATLVGAAIWAAAMGGSALFDLVLAHWETPASIRTIVALFALGGALAFPPALMLARFLSLGRRPEVAFASAFLSLAVVTIAVTASLYALQYRRYYAEWHADAFTVTWAFQLVFTGLVSLYQFAVLGLRLYFPFGFVALFAAALWFARSQR